ncbi:hypothetical protein EW146_g8337 [Bondarzewia mesenterica]|uniref:Cytochrome P450 n=1 Tax=Bondarzewia mesenterica TaxID=1095465 RepID=A0A4S4LFG5_9AGAM|nr:hypothetical protein EW146_g8337 [Bondarzewia mesenterica]
MLTFTPVLFVLGILGLCLLRAFVKKTRYPPGPKGLPFLGNIFSLPTTKTWKYFELLSHKYGSIVRLSLAGNDLIILSDPRDAEELLGRRSWNYSSRKPLVYAGKYQSNNKRLVLLEYGDSLKKQRTAFHQMLQPRVVGAYESIQEIESAKLVHDMLVRSEDSTRNCKRFSASLVFHLSYGKRLDDDDQDLVAIGNVLENFVRDTYPGAHLVDSLPILDYLPGFCAPWRSEARRKHDVEMKLYQRLVLEVKEKMDNGDIGLECFAGRLWDQKTELGLDLEELSYVAGSAFEAGTDTTTGTLQWFLMAMVLYPNTMMKAQAEIDALLGSDGSSMPSFAHINDLPYCIAVAKEVFRWAPAAPGGFPHYSGNDDEYKGYKHHNESEFPNPYEFIPERFIRDGNFKEHDPLTEGHYGFGFGSTEDRRKCPGQYLGAKSIWIGLTRLLWGFHIGPQCNRNGLSIPVNPDNCTSGMTSKPLDFPLVITVRSANHARTIEREWELNK